MSGASRVAALEQLLERVKHNAALPRPARAVAAVAAAPEPASELDLQEVDEPTLLALPSVEPASLEELEDDIDLVTVPPPAPAAAAAPAMPAAIAAPASPREEVHREAEPLDANDVEPASGVVPLQDDLSTEGELELDSGELIDVTDLGPDEVAAIEAEAAELEAAELAAAGLELGEFEAAEPPALDEPVPSSSRRAKVPAATMDEALASAAAALDDAEREVPLHTPPPESGRLESAVHVPAHVGPPDDLLEMDEPLVARAPQVGPTTEQLGQTIELDEPLGGDLELDPAGAAPTPPPPPRDDLEHELPGGAPTAYDGALELPPEAHADLLRHRIGDRAASSGARAPTPVHAAAGAADAPVVVERPALYAQPAEVVGARPNPEPRSFRDLLDRALSL